MGRADEAAHESPYQKWQQDEGDGHAEAAGGDRLDADREQGVSGTGIGPYRTGLEVAPRHPIGGQAGQRDAAEQQDLDGEPDLAEEGGRDQGKDREARGG